MLVAIGAPAGAIDQFAVDLRRAESPDDCAGCLDIQPIHEPVCNVGDDGGLRVSAPRFPAIEHPGDIAVGGALTSNDTIDITTDTMSLGANVTGSVAINITNSGAITRTAGQIIGTTLTVLVVAQIARIGWKVAKKRATLSTRPVWDPPEVIFKRLGMVAVTIAFIVTIPWMGLTLGLFVWMFVALWIMGIRRIGVLTAIAGVVALSSYLLFIAALDSDFPHGPIENAIAAARS